MREGLRERERHVDGDIRGYGDAIQGTRVGTVRYRYRDASVRWPYGDIWYRYGCSSLED